MTGRTSTGAPRRQTALTRAEIVTEALLLIDERGLDALSMRALGSRLGVEAMAIYRHVPDKRALLDGVAERLLSELGDGAPPDGDWRTVLNGFAHEYRRMAEAHPNAIPLLSGRPGRAYLAARDGAEGLLECLVRDGFRPSEAAMALRLVGRFVIGFSLDARRVESPLTDTARELADDGYPLLGTLLEQLVPSPVHDWELFTFGLAVLLDGLQERLHRP